MQLDVCFKMMRLTGWTEFSSEKYYQLDLDSFSRVFHIVESFTSALNINISCCSQKKYAKYRKKILASQQKFLSASSNFYKEGQDMKLNLKSYQNEKDRKI